MILDVFYCDVAESIHQVSESHVQWSSRLRTSQRTLVPEAGGAQRFNPDILVTESFTTCFFFGNYLEYTYASNRPPCKIVPLSKLMHQRCKPRIGHMLHHQLHHAQDRMWRAAKRKKVKPGM